MKKHNRSVRKDGSVGRWGSFDYHQIRKEYNLSVGADKYIDFGILGKTSISTIRNVLYPISLK